MSAAARPSLLRLPHCRRSIWWRSYADDPVETLSQTHGMARRSAADAWFSGGLPAKNARALAAIQSGEASPRSNAPFSGRNTVGVGDHRRTASLRRRPAAGTAPKGIGDAPVDDDATPIPRTLAERYADPDVSVIDEMPVGRRRHETAGRSAAANRERASSLPVASVLGMPAYRGIETRTADPVALHADLTTTSRVDGRLAAWTHERWGAR